MSPMELKQLRLILHFEPGRYYTELEARFGYDRYIVMTSLNQGVKISWAFGRSSAGLVHRPGGLDYRLWAHGCQSA